MMQQFPVTETSGAEVALLGNVHAATWGSVARTAACERVRQGTRAAFNHVSRVRIRQKYSDGADREPSSSVTRTTCCHSGGGPATEANPKASDKRKSAEQDTAAEEAFPSRGHAALLRKARASMERENGRSVNEDVPKGLVGFRPS